VLRRRPEIKFFNEGRRSGHASVLSHSQRHYSTAVPVTRHIDNAMVKALAPAIVEAILNGRDVDELSLAKILQPFPSSWAEQLSTFSPRRINDDS